MTKKFTDVEIDEVVGNVKRNVRKLTLTDSMEDDFEQLLIALKQVRGERDAVVLTLNETLENQVGKINELEKENDELKKRVAELELEGGGGMTTDEIKQRIARIKEEIHQSSEQAPPYVEELIDSLGELIAEKEAWEKEPYVVIQHHNEGRLPLIIEMDRRFNVPFQDEQLMGKYVLIERWERDIQNNKPRPIRRLPERGEG